MNFKSHPVAEFILLSFYETAFNPLETSYELDGNSLIVRDNEKNRICFAYERTVRNKNGGSNICIIADEAGDFYEMTDGKWSVAPYSGIDQLNEMYSDQDSKEKD